MFEAHSSIDVLKVGFALMLVVTTTLLFNIDVRYRTVSGNMVFNYDFRNGLLGWDIINNSNDVSVVDEHLELRTISGSSGIRQMVPLDKEVRALRIVVEVATTYDSLYGEGRPVGLVRFKCREGAGEAPLTREMEFEPKVLGTSIETWTQYQDVFAIPEKSDMCSLEVYALKESAEVLKVKDISVLSESQKEYWPVLYYIVLVLWVCAAVWICISVSAAMKSSSWRLHCMVALCLVAVSAMLPGPIKRSFEGLEEYSDSCLSLIPFAYHMDYFIPICDPVKFAHITIFAFVAIVARLAWPARGSLVLITYLSVLAASAEVLQFFAVERTPRIVDWGFDILGVFLGLLAGSMVVACKRLATR